MSSRDQDLERASRGAQAVLAGEVRAAARLMRGLDDDEPWAAEALRLLWPHTGRAFILGITGNPGAGKSTVVDGLLRHYRASGVRVGVVVVDPSSPFSGGAILGDRIRMQRHATDEGVFIRSTASRGHLGGLSSGTSKLLAVLDAMGFPLLIVETVGVGQGEVDIVSLADTTVVVTVPGLGDEVQALKAGILEIADVLVVNKADREGAERSVRDLLAMLSLRQPERGGHALPPVEIVRTVAIRGEGIAELCDAIARHRERTRADAPERRRQRAENALREAIQERLGREVDRVLSQNSDIIDDVAERRRDPEAAAEDIARGLLRR